MWLRKFHIHAVHLDAQRIRNFYWCIFRLYLSASVTMEFLNKEKFTLPLHRTIPINLEVESCSLTGMLHQKVIRAEKPELETQIHRIKLDVCFLRDERKSLQVRTRFCLHWNVAFVMRIARLADISKCLTMFHQNPWRPMSVWFPS